jgi:hypothetical protein
MVGQHLVEHAAEGENVGALVDGKPRDALRDEMIELMVRVMNGEPTQAERNGMDVFTFMTVHPPLMIQEGILRRASAIPSQSTFDIPSRASTVAEHPNGEEGIG